MAREAISDPKSENVTTSVDKTLCVDRLHPGGIVIFEGTEPIAQQDRKSKARWARWVRQFGEDRRPITDKVAFIGAGTCFMPMMLNIRYRDGTPGRAFGE